jgi:FkbM family methyltransferase
MTNTNTQEQHWIYTTEEWSSGYYFRDIFNILKDHKIETFIDIGANTGALAHLILDKIPTIKKGYLFEPQKDNFNFLFKKCKDKKELTCLNCGIYYGKSYSIPFRYGSDKNIGGYTIHENEKNVTAKAYEPDDQFFQLFELEFFNFPIIDFVKIDIEGAEYNLIENSSLLKKVKFIDIELHNGFDENYFKTHFPNHDIIYYGMFNDTVSHILLKLR